MNALCMLSWIRLGALAAASTISIAVRAESPVTCVAAFDRGQELQLALQLRAAREQYLACSRDACHALVRKDCATHLDEVTRDLPTVTLAARDRAGKDLPRTRVWLDGTELEPAKLTSAVAVDPGAHALRFEHPSLPPHEESIVARVGEKNRAIVAVLEAPTPSSRDAAGARAVGASPAGAQDPPTSNTLGFVLAGASALSLSGFAFFGVSGLNEKDRLLDTCAAACSDAEVATVRNRYLAADALLTVGVVTGVAAVYLLLRKAPAAKPTWATAAR